MKGIIKDFILNSIAAGVLCHRRLRMKIYRLYGAEITADCEIKPRCYLGLGKGHIMITIHKCYIHCDVAFISNNNICT